MSKFCINCGREIQKDDIFCVACGKNQTELVGSMVSDEIQPIGEKCTPKKVLESRNGSIDEESSLQNEPINSERAIKKTSKKPLVFAVCSIVILIIVALMVFFYINNKERKTDVDAEISAKQYETKNNVDTERVTDEENDYGLCDINGIEQKINEVFTKAFGEEFDGVTQFKIENADEELYDQTFNCFIVPAEDGVMGLRAMGLIKNGKVIQFQCVYAGLEETYSQLSSYNQAAVSTIVTHAVCIFKEDVDPYNFAGNMGVADNGLRTVEGDVEYTYMGNVGNGIALFSFNIRYLPAFGKGFFQDDDNNTENEVYPGDVTPDYEENINTDISAPEVEHTHSFGNWVNDYNGTTHSKACSCGQEELEYHTYDSGEVTKEPTDMITGEKVYTCTVCGAVKIETIAKLQHTHSFGNWRNDNNGLTHSRVCLCWQQEFERHAYGSGEVTKEPTETETGVKSYVCMICGAVKTETIAKLQHTHIFGNWLNKPDYDSSSHLRYCSCGYEEWQIHSYDSGVVTKEATETETGIKTYTCTVCGATKTKTLLKLEHTHSFGSWINDYNGSTHSKTCSCGEYKSEKHSFDSGRATKEPTYDSQGIKTYTCYICGATKTESIPKLDSPVEQPKSDTREHDYKCICNYCNHNDGAMHLVLENGVKVDVIWTCSACGKENWDYMTMTW